jgi:hypothetical protein
VPPLDPDVIGKEPMKFTIDRLYHGICVVQEQEVWKVNEEEISWFSGYRFAGNSSRKLRYLHELGYVTSTRRTRLAYGEDGYRRLTNAFFESIPDVYDFRIEADVPPWLFRDV